MAAEGSSDRIIYLHGDLELKILKGRSIPNMDAVTQHLRHCFTACGTTCKPPSSTDMKVDHHRKIIATDPYVTVSVPGATVARTRVIRNAHSPEWNQHFHIPLAHPVNNLEFQIKDNDMFGAELVGTVLIPAKSILTGELISGWFPVIGSNGKPPMPNTALLLEMKFTPCGENPLYRHGIAGDPEHLGVRNTYFPLRKGESVTLYQDAHGHDGLLPKIELDEGRLFKQHPCWEDICYAISEAHHMIYLAGWSIYHKVKLIREPTRPLPRGSDLNLGELLRYKSQEGV